VIALPVPAAASATFHGRDVFAPAAAALARGEPIDALGHDAAQPIIRRTPEAVRRADGGIEGEIIAVDRFGNAVTNIVGLRGGTISVGDTSMSVRHTYSEVSNGDPVAVVGSTGFIEIAVRNGSAAESLGLTRGQHVIFRHETLVAGR
jgi:S-adenosylmethionine hydrolase